MFTKAINIWPSSRYYGPFCTRTCINPLLVWYLGWSILTQGVRLHFSNYYFFYLILYVPVNNFSVMSVRVFLGWTSNKQGLLCQRSDAIEALTHSPSVSSLESSTLPPSLSNSIVHMYLFVWIFFLPYQTVKTQMKCSIMLHFIWGFTVCQSIRLWVSSKQKVLD